MHPQRVRRGEEARCGEADLILEALHELARLLGGDRAAAHVNLGTRRAVEVRSLFRGGARFSGARRARGIDPSERAYAEEEDDHSDHQIEDTTGRRVGDT